jgi:hypothetical protein
VGGLAELAFLVQLTNVIAPSFAFLFRLDDMQYIHFLSRMACGRDYAYIYLQPPAFRMNLRMGQAINTVGLALLYAPILPLSPIIGFAGVVVQYCVDQYIALRRSSKPRNFQVDALSGANYVLRLLPLFQVLLCGGVYFKHVEGAWVPVALGIVIWGLAGLMPLMNRIRQSEYTKWVEGGRPRLLDWAKQPGEEANLNLNQELHLAYAKPGFYISALDVLPDIPQGFRINYDTYLPDVPTLVRMLQLLRCPLVAFRRMPCVTACVQ